MIPINASSGQYDSLQRVPGDTLPAIDFLTMADLHHAVVMEAATGVMIVSASIRPMVTEFVNPAFERITGYTSAEVVGQPPGRLSNNDLDQPGLYELQRAIAAGMPAKVIVRNYRKDGSLFWNELSISPVRDGAGRLSHWLGLLNDVTAFQSAQNELLARGMRLETLSSLSADGLVTFDANERVAYVNKALLDHLGLAQSEILGATIREFDGLFSSCSDPRQPVIAMADSLPVSARTDSHADESVSELHLLKPEPRVLLRRILRGSHGVSWLAYFQDITKARQVEQIKSEFLATAAHELRTPMASILGFAELLQQRQFDQATMHDLLDIIVRQSRRITDLLNELLDLARIEARRGKDFKRIEVDVRDVVRTATEAMPELAGRLSLTGMKEAVMVKVDIGKIQQALTNLLSNAVKFSAPDAEVSVAIRQERAASRVGITVKDHGIGMTKAERARLGERFFRADPSGNVPGTGLGVSLLKEIINLHGGHFDAACAPGKGCSMTVWLPLSQPGAASPPA